MFEAVRARIERASRYSSDRWLYAWALGYAAIGAASLLVPVYALVLGADPFVVGLVEATAGLAGVPGALLWGRLADRTGQRRTFVMITLVGTGIVLAIFPFIDTLSFVVTANAVLWFAVAAATPVVTLFMIEDVPEREWEARIGLLNAYQRYGWVGGLVVGAVWLGVVSSRFSPVIAQRSFFVVCALAALAATPLAFYWLPPEATTRPIRLARSSRAFYRLVAGSGRYVKLIPYAPSRAALALESVGRGEFLGQFPDVLRRYLLVTFIFSAAFAVFFGPVPAYLTGLEYSSAFIFGFFIVSSFASALVFVPVGRLAGRTNPKSLQLRALGLRVLLFPAIGLVGLVPQFGLRAVGLGIGFALIGLTWAVVAVTAAGLVSRTAPRDVRGEALGMYTALSGIGGGIGGIAGGLLAQSYGFHIAFGVAGVLVLASIVVLLLSPIAIESIPIPFPSTSESTPNADE